MRDAINLLDQLVSYKGNDITINDVYDITGLVSYEIIYELLLSSYNKDMSSIVKILDDINYSGKNISKFIEEIILFLKDVLVYKNITDYSLNLDKLNKVKEISDLYDNNLIYNYVNELNNVLNNIKNSSYPLLLLEVALIKLVNLEKKEESILEKVNVKESKNNVKADKNTSNMSIKNDIIKEDVFPKLSNEELKHISYLKEVRVNNAFVSLLMVIPSAVKVTAIINNIGIQSIQPWRFVFLRNTAQATRASTDNSWLAEPNNGQISAYPTFVSR